MAKHVTLHSVQRGLATVPAGVVVTDLSADELKVLERTRSVRPFREKDDAGLPVAPTAKEAKATAAVEAEAEVTVAEKAPARKA